MGKDDVLRIERANAFFERLPSLCTPEQRACILKGIIVTGMDPAMARLATGSAFTFKMVADVKWPQNTPPQDVIDAQSLNPDETRLWMMFETKTQFSTKDPILFCAYFEHGTCKEVNRIERK